MIIRPSVQALEVFLSVARHGSFRRAAAERGVTPSALSHLMRGLEENLGVRLFHRTSRSVALTEAGRHLLERIGPSLNELTRVLDNVKASATARPGSCASTRLVSRWTWCSSRSLRHFSPPIPRSGWRL